MNKNKLLESLNQELGSQVSMRRYSLADMLSESYKVIYKCGEGSNLRKLAESHLNDVKTNPRDISRLSRQLCIVKELVKLTESGELKDEDLVDKKCYDEVEGKEERVVVKQESLDEAKEEYVWGDWQIERGNPRKVKYYTAGKDILNKIIGVVYAPATDSFRYGAEIYNNETDETVIGYAEFDDEDTAVRWVEDKFSHQSAPASVTSETSKSEEIVVDENNTTESEGRKLHSTEDLKEATDPDEDDLTDEELEELAKHLENIRKERKSNKIAEEKEELKEDAGTGRVSQIGVDIYFHNDVDTRPTESKIAEILQNAGFDVVGCMFSDTSWTPEEYGISDLDREGTEKYNESKEGVNESYKGLENFKKQSVSKAFYKTFKKMHESLKEGKALTRKESIDLYKASNSALTQLSIELEHNPEFLDTFKESVTLLSKDVNSLLESLSRGKAPSKATMKSLAKFSAYILEGSGVYYPNGKEVPEDSVDMNKALDYNYGTDRDKDNSKYTVEEKQRSINYWIKKRDGLSPFDKISVDESEENSMNETPAESYMKNWAEMDHKKGSIIDDYDEWSKLCSEEGIIPSKELYDKYLAHYNSLNESEEEDIEDEEISAEETPEDFVGDSEGDIQSEEADQFDQEYADARFEIHSELEDKHEDSEDPDVQDKLEQDKEEVIDLPGISDEQVAELSGEEDTEETPVEPESELSPEDDEVVDDVTDDELEELKKHLQEMRSAKKVEKSIPVEELAAQVRKALDDAGISYSIKGRAGDTLIVSRKDLDRASEIRTKLDPKYTITVASPL